MLVNVFFDSEEYADIITVPEQVGDIEMAQKVFFDWLFDKNNNHKYWVTIDNEKKYCNYGTEAFIEWLNNIFLKNYKEKAELLKKNCQHYSKHNKKLYF